jgi:hypothetical protein
MHGVDNVALRGGNTTRLVSPLHAVMAERLVSGSGFTRRRAYTVSTFLAAATPGAGA